jgi:uncharacterized phage infection (PIP) family protein YhgE
MTIAKPIGPAQIDQSSETAETANIQRLTRVTDLSNKDVNVNDEISTNKLDRLLRQVSEASTGEIENLISELQGLRNKLQSNGNRIQSDIAKYTELSQGVLQLVTIISDSVKKLPGAPRIAR